MHLHFSEMFPFHENFNCVFQALTKPFVFCFLPASTHLIGGDAVCCISEKLESFSHLNCVNCAFARKQSSKQPVGNQVVVSMRYEIKRICAAFLIITFL